MCTPQNMDIKYVWPERLVCVRVLLAPPSIQRAWFMDLVLWLPFIVIFAHKRHANTGMSKVFIFLGPKMSRQNDLWHCPSTVCRWQQPTTCTYGRCHLLQGPGNTHNDVYGSIHVTTTTYTLVDIQLHLSCCS